VQLHSCHLGRLNIPRKDDLFSKFGTFLQHSGIHFGKTVGNVTNNPVSPEVVLNNSPKIKITFPPQTSRERRAMSSRKCYCISLRLLSKHLERGQREVALAQRLAIADSRMAFIRMPWTVLEKKERKGIQTKQISR